MGSLPVSHLRAWPPRPVSQARHLEPRSRPSRASFESWPDERSLPLGLASSLRAWLLQSTFAKFSADVLCPPQAISVLEAPSLGRTLRNS